jgi:hypothetical protein
MKRENRILTAWMPKITANADAKGFGTKKLTADYVTKKFNLVISELGEAVEADRKGRTADLVKFKRRMISYTSSVKAPMSEDEAFFEAFEETIKDTVADEIADTVIRLLHIYYLLGARQLTKTIYPMVFPSNPQLIVLEAVNRISAIGITYLLETGSTTKLREKTQEEKETDLVKCLQMLFVLSAVSDFDLLHHIEMKMKYNSMREKKHGNNKY